MGGETAFSDGLCLIVNTPRLTQVRPRNGSYTITLLLSAFLYEKKRGLCRGNFETKPFYLPYCRSGGIVRLQQRGRGSRRRAHPVSRAQRPLPHAENRSVAIEHPAARCRLVHHHHRQRKTGRRSARKPTAAATVSTWATNCWTESPSWNTSAKTAAAKCPTVANWCSTGRTTRQWPD